MIDLDALEALAEKATPGPVYVGDDEADASQGRVGWNAPIARALRGARLGDVRRVVLPSGAMDYEVIDIRYP